MFIRFSIPSIIYVDENNGIEVFKAGADILRSGKTLIIFPEGTRTSDGTLQQFRSGVSYPAKKTNRPVIPVSVTGAYYIWPRNRLLPKIMNSRSGGLYIGDEIHPEGYESIESLNMAMSKAINDGINKARA